MAVKNIVRQNQRKVGRPATVEAEKAIGIRLPGRLLEAIDAWAKANDASRSEAIRRMTECYLATESEPAKRPRKPKAD
jgi:metal-responsive CopG/Arc/MetJ family transcriptional regulator